MGDDPKAGNPRHPAPDAGYTSPGSGPDRREKRPGIALPADLGRSLRLLDNAQLDRLMKAVADEVRRRGRNAPDRPSVAGRSASSIQAKTARAKPTGPDNAATVTSGQQRLILAAYKASLKPAAIAKEFRVSRATVQNVITSAGAVTVAGWCQLRVASSFLL